VDFIIRTKRWRLLFNTGPLDEAEMEFVRLDEGDLTPAPCDCSDCEPAEEDDSDAFGFRVQRRRDG